MRSLTWRISGVALAVLLTWWLTGDPRLGVELGVAYNAIRLATHYFHDRGWAHIGWGMRHHHGRPPGLRGRNGSRADGNGAPAEAACGACGQPLPPSMPPVLLDAATPDAPTAPPRPLLGRVLRRAR